jgi:ABC-type uncharacterized transport system substrate-binding protein
MGSHDPGQSEKFFFMNLTSGGGEIMQPRRPWLLICFFFFLIECPPSFLLAAEAERIFILHSYQQADICGQPQADGLIAVLDEAGYKVGEHLVVESYYMDTKRRHNTPELIAEQARLALARIGAFRPRVLVTLDDTAFREVALALVNSPVQIVFSGLNGQPEEYHLLAPFLENRIRPGHNVTGVYEKLHFADAVKIQKKIFPDLHHVRVLSDLSPTGKAITRQIELELAAEEVPVAVDVKITRSWEDYQAEIRAIDRDPEIGTIYPVALLLKDGAGRTYTAPEILGWTVAHSRKPDIALNYAFISLGLFGGAAVDFEAMGRQAGEMVARILRGEKTGEIAIEEAKRFALVFNLARARQLGITIPEDILLAADEIVMVSGK